MTTSSNRRARPRSALREFLNSEASGGILLMAAAALALAVANSPAASAYFSALEFYAGPLPLVHWINDGLMAIFFFLVGLEIKREWFDGRLSSWEDRRLPLVAAIAGMALPAVIYLAIVGSSSDLVRGWAIGAATDIAFAVGVLALLGKRAPASLKLFLVTVAVIDDIGAVAIIALFYTADLNFIAAGAAAAILVLMLGMNNAAETRLWPYLALAMLLWVAVLLSGVHATIAGVLAALTIPLMRSPGAPDSQLSPLHRLEHRIQPWVAFAILPLFGFANAGVSLEGIGLQNLVEPLPLAIATALFVGKQTAIFASVRLMAALGFADRPVGASWLQLYGISLLCGVGFTMSLFIGNLAFPDPVHLPQVKIGVLTGSLASALAGYCILRFAAPPDRGKSGLARPEPVEPDPR